MRTTFNVRVTDVRADGSLRSDMKVADIEITDITGLDSATTANLLAQLSPLVGLTAWVVTDALGAGIDAGTEIPTDTWTQPSSSPCKAPSTH